MPTSPSDRYDATSLAAEVPDLADAEPVSIAGRVVLWRRFGSLVFGQVLDRSGVVQVALSKGELEVKDFKLWSSGVKLGDHIGVSGRRWTSKTGEPTVAVASLVVLNQAAKPLPAKWQGLDDPDERQRRRYLDLLLNPASADRFRTRSQVTSCFRRVLDEAGFLEVETPILQDAAAGASAKPFVTHHDALDRDFYLRISPETYLKRLVTGGFDRVYEMSRNFRNEGMDATHLQEFTLLEWYASYWNYRDNMEFTRKMINRVIQDATGSLELDVAGEMIDFGADWPIIDYRDAVLEATGIDLRQVRDIGELQARITEKRVGVEVDMDVSYAALVDRLYKRTVRPKLVEPCFLIHHPVEMVPLARKSDADSSQLDMYQVVVNGWELVKGYSELVDPVDQRRRLEEQAALRKAGDDEAMMLEEDFIEAMEFGMPPMSGAGLGIDRLVALITGASTLRDVVLFPTMRARSE